MVLPLLKALVSALVNEWKLAQATFPSIVRVLYVDFSREYNECRSCVTPQFVEETKYSLGGTVMLVASAGELCYHYLVWMAVGAPRVVEVVPVPGDGVRCHSAECVRQLHAPLGIDSPGYQG